MEPPDRGHQRQRIHYDRDTTWTVADSPCIVTGSITVQGTDGADGVTTLTIEPGVQVRGHRFRINIGGSSGHPGALIARGRHDAPIVFTSNQATRAPGDWFGITFNPTSAAYSAMEHCTVEFAGYGGTAAIHIRNASPSIADSTIGSNSVNGINISSGTPAITGNTFVANGKYDIVYGNPSGGLLTGNMIANGFTFTGGSLGEISGNILNYNNAYPVSVPADWVGRLLHLNTINNTDQDSHLNVQAGTVSRDALWTAQIKYRLLGNIRVQGTDGPDNVTTLKISPGGAIDLGNAGRYTEPR